MNNWINSPVFTTIIGAVVGAISTGVATYYFGLKRDKKIKNLEAKNRRLKKDNKAIREIKKNNKEVWIIKQLLQEREEKTRLEENIEKKRTWRPN